MKISTGLKVIANVLWIGMGFAADSSYWRLQVSRVAELEARGDFEGAKQVLHRIITDRESRFLPDEAVPSALNRLASLEQDQAHYREAERLYRRAIQVWESRPGAPDIGLAHALNNLGSLYLEMGQPGRAQALRLRSLNIRVQLLGPEHPDVALAYSNLAADTYRLGRYSEAESFCRRALAIWSRLPGDPNYADRTLNTLALIRLEEHDYDQALALIQDCIRGLAPAKSRELPSYLNTLAVIYARAGRLQDSEAVFQRALESSEIRSNPQSPQTAIQTAILLANYSHLLKRTGRKAEGRAIQRQATALHDGIVRANGLQYSVDISAFQRSGK
jgi:tetratricopeptide (TPR) repeat protein